MKWALCLWMLGYAIMAMASNVGESLPIAHLVRCTNPVTAATEWIGTAVAIDKHTVLTAGHMLCDDGYIMFYAQGETWIPLAALVKSETNDMLLLVSTGATVKGPYVKFADARLGEQVWSFGYGLLFMTHHGLLTSGIVSAIEPDKILSDNKVFPGMSGGPLLNSEGYVVGMVIESDGDQLGGPGSPVQIISVEVPSSLLKAFIETHRQK